MCINTERRTVEINWDENGIEFNLGELRVLSLYFMKGDKFWSQLQFILRLMAQGDHVSTICEWLDQRTIYALVLEKKQILHTFIYQIDIK